MSILDTSQGSFAVDEAHHRLTFERVLEATPDEVFAAWTVPAQLAAWWDPTGEPLAVCEIDLRPGGAFRFTGRHHADRPFTGIYREITPPTLLIFEANGATGIVRLTARGSSTILSVQIVCRSQEHLAQFVSFGVAVGTEKTLDNLVAYFDR